MRLQSPHRGPDERGDGRSREGSLGKERLDPAVADLPGGARTRHPLTPPPRGGITQLWLTGQRRWGVAGWHWLVSGAWSGWSVHRLRMLIMQSENPRTLWVWPATAIAHA